MFQSLSRLFARRPDAPPARKASLGVHLIVLEVWAVMAGLHRLARR